MEEAKAVQETAKTVSKIMDSAEKFGGFIAKYTHEALEAGIGIFSDKLKYLRWERQCRLMKRAEEFAIHENLTEVKRAIPLKLAIPLLEAASLEEDDSIQDLYAKLLINSSSGPSGVTLMRSYIDSLERFNPLMVKIFNNIYKTLPNQIKYQDPKITLPEDMSSAIIGGKYSEETELAWNELDRLGCLRVKRQMNSGQLSMQAKPTLYGMALYKACTLASERTSKLK